MNVKRSAREIKEMEFAQKNADEAIKRHMDENLELLRLMRKTIEKLGEVQTENTSLITTIESQKEEIEKLKEVNRTIIFNSEMRNLTPMQQMSISMELLSGRIKISDLEVE